MDYQTHYSVAKAHFSIAEEYDLKFRKGTDKTVNMIVAAQNYFYAAINAIEAKLAKELELHSYSHENRLRKVLENRQLFSQQIITLFEKVERDERNKVAYRGKNGKMYEDIKKLAKELIQNETGL